jgi:hypothetical protein
MARPHNPLPSVPEPTLPPDILEPESDSYDSTTDAAVTLNTARHGNGHGPAITAAASELARARWATESEHDQEVRDYFSTVPLEEGLSLLARMRNRCELAARAIETRRTAETLDTACLICGVTKRKLGNRNWRMVRSRRDTTTGTFVTEYFCSDACIVEDNRKKHGIAAMSDRGMLPGDDPSRAKNSIIAHQAKVKSDAELAASVAAASSKPKAK